MFDYKKFGNGLRYFRIKNGLSQEKLAEKVDISVPYLNKIENAHVKPSLDLMINLCNAFKISLNDCLNFNSDNSNVLYKQFKASIAFLNKDEKAFLAKTIHSMIKF